MLLIKLILVCILLLTGTINVKHRKNFGDEHRPQPHLHVYVKLPEDIAGDIASLNCFMTRKDGTELKSFRVPCDNVGKFVKAVVSNYVVPGDYVLRVVLKSTQGFNSVVKEPVVMNNKKRLGELSDTLYSFPTYDKCDDEALMYGDDTMDCLHYISQRYRVLNRLEQSDTDISFSPLKTFTAVLELFYAGQLPGLMSTICRVRATCCIWSQVKAIATSLIRRVSNNRLKRKYKYNLREGGAKDVEDHLRSVFGDSKWRMIENDLKNGNLHKVLSETCPVMQTPLSVQDGEDEDDEQNEDERPQKKQRRN
ncbi:hypothetical protein MP638_006859 [Amoeboaphelidium occidentale]|nr:hypothetical protein MP638_006859 [Amoeboaphelidium occidentale]